jgi:hypothetical protein
MYVLRNIEARSRNHCCCGKAINITYSDFVFDRYPACKAHATYCILFFSGLSGCTVFIHVTNDAILGGNKVIGHKICACWFSPRLSSETFLILTIIKLDIIINVRQSSCKVPVSYCQRFIELGCSLQILEKS